MLSILEQHYINNLLKQMYLLDYKEYVCYTDNESKTDCYFTQDNIVNNDLTFNIDSGQHCCLDIQNGEQKFTCSNFDTQIITINSDNYVYSSVGYFSNPIAEFSYKVLYDNHYYSTSLNNNLSLNHFYIIPILLSLIFCYPIIKSWFKKRV